MEARHGGKHGPEVPPIWWKLALRAEGSGVDGLGGEAGDGFCSLTTGFVVGGQDIGDGGEFCAGGFRQDFFYYLGDA